MTKNRRSITVRELVVVVLIVLVLLAMASIATPLQLLFTVFFGWVSFLFRVVPQLTWNLDGWLTALVSAALFFSGLHWIAKWIAKANGRTWRTQTSFALAAVTIFIFAAGVSAIGIVHQAGWIVKIPAGDFVHGWRKEGLGRALSTNNLRRIGIAAVDFADQKGHLPIGASAGPNGELLHGWLTSILPQLEQKNIYDGIALNQPWNTEANSRFTKLQLSAFQSPSVDPLTDAAGYGLAHYAGNSQVLRLDTPMKLSEITDGVAYTILAGEVATGFRPWAHPLNLRDPAVGIGQGPNQFGFTRIDGTLVFIMVDGCCRTVTKKVSAEVLKALATPNGHDDPKLDGND